MELLFGSGQQPPVHPSDGGLPDTVCIKLRFVRHEDTSFVRSCLIRIHDTVEWDFARFLRQVGIFKQLYGIVGKIGIGIGKRQGVGQHDHLLVLESRNDIGKAAPGQQQVVLVDPPAILGLLPLFQPLVFQDGGVVSDQPEPVTFSFDD